MHAHPLQPLGSLAGMCPVSLLTTISLRSLCCLLFLLGLDHCHHLNLTVSTGTRASFQLQWHSSRAKTRRMELKKSLCVS